MTGCLTDCFAVLLIFLRYLSSTSGLGVCLDTKSRGSEAMREVKGTGILGGLLECAGELGVALIKKEN